MDIYFISLQYDIQVEYRGKIVFFSLFNESRD